MADDRNRVVIVGGGLAGIAAACECLESGCSVTLIDKNPRPTSGNSSKASSGILAPLPQRQKEAGITDNRADIDAVCKADPAAAAVISKAGDVEWLLKTLQVLDYWKYTTTTSTSGQRVLGHKNPHESGQALCAMAATLFNVLNKTKKLEILRGSTVISLLSEDLGGGRTRVFGVECMDEQAKKNKVMGQVILCVGGSAGSAGKLKNIPSSCDAGIDGSSLSLATAIGADTERLQQFNTTPFACAYPGDKGTPDEEKFALTKTLCGEGCAIVNAKGVVVKDLVNTSHLDIVKAMTVGEAERQKNPFYLVIAKVPAGTQGTIDWYVRSQFMQMYTHIPAAATGCNVPVSVLEAAFQGLGKPKNVYAVNICQAVYSCPGGLQVDPDGKVKGRKQFDGLYAAGEAAAGPGEAAYALAGFSLLQCVVSGRAAAKTAAAAVFAGTFGSSMPAREDLEHLVKNQMLHSLKGGDGAEVAKVDEKADDEKMANMSKEELIKLVRDLKAAGPPAPKEAPPPEPTGPPPVTLDEVGKHNKKEDAWIALNGEVIDVTKFINNHPGGEQAICAFLGKDATAEWNQIHKPGTVERVGLKKGAVKVGVLGGPGGAAPAAAPSGPAPGEITLDEVAKHNKKEDAWIVINGDVLDVTDFINKHPGGVEAICSLIGKDASSDWNSIHKPGTVERVGLKAGAKKIGKCGAPGAGTVGPSEPPFWDLPPCEEGEGKMGGWIGSLIYLLLNLANNLVRTFLYTGNLRFNSERMGTIRSGLFLVFFVVAHSMDNQVTHLGRVQYNSMSFMMADGIQGAATGGFPWFDTYIIMAVMLHVCVALKRSWEINMDYTLASGRWKWLISGLFILFFLVNHLVDFRFAGDVAGGDEKAFNIVKIYMPKTPGNAPKLNPFSPPFVFFCEPNAADAYVVEGRDIYGKAWEAFQSPTKVLQYLAFVTAVVSHLFWAWPKVCTSEGLAIPTGHQGRVTKIGWAMACVCGLLYSSIPICFYIGIMPSPTEPDTHCGLPTF